MEDKVGLKPTGDLVSVRVRVPPRAQISKMIIFTRHAKNKFEILKRHKFLITKKQVLRTVEEPDLIDKSRLPLLIAQRKIDKRYVLRVVYKIENGNIKIITFYPGRRKQYGE